jgi:hypothetical protein
MKQSEIDSDLHAIRLVGSRSAATSTITKLAQKFAGGDLSQPTHFALVDGTVAGVLTYGERLYHISNAI